MAYSHSWFVNRRSTYTIDTPCLTKHFVIKPAVVAADDAVPSDQTVFDENKRRLAVIDSMRLADAIAREYCEHNSERFLNRDGHGNIGPDGQPRKSFTELCSDVTPSVEEAINAALVGGGPKQQANADLDAFCSSVDREVTWSRFETLFLEKKQTPKGKTDAGYLEVLCDLQSEIITVQFRLYPFAKSFLERFKDDPLLSKIRGALNAISNQKAQNLFGASVIKADNSKIRQKEKSEDLIETIFETVWKDLRISQSDLTDLISKHVAHAQRVYDDIGSNNPRAPINAQLAKTYLRLHELEKKAEDDRKTRADSDKLPEQPAHIHPAYIGQVRIMAITEGMVLRRRPVRNDFSSKLKRVTGHKIDVYNNLRDQRKSDIEDYNSSIISGAFADAYIPEFEPTYNQKARVEELGSLTFSDNVMQIQEHSIFFKTLLGFWPDNPKLKSAARDTHTASAVVSGFLDGLAVNGVTYLPSKTEGELGVVRYFLLYAGPSRNQLARLVRRLHACGDSRIMLADQFIEMKNAAQALNYLDQEIEKRIANDNAGAKFLEEKRYELNQIKLSVEGGIQHRILQSQIYWERLLEGIENLREVRIRGWQTYEDFVQRNYGPQINSFDRTQNRLDSVDTRLSNARAIQDVRLSRIISSTIMLGAILAVFGLAVRLIRSFYVSSGAHWIEQILAGLGLVAAAIIFSIMIIRLMTNGMLRDLGKSIRKIYRYAVGCFHRRNAVRHSESDLSEETSAPAD